MERPLAKHLIMQYISKNWLAIILGLAVCYTFGILWRSNGDIFPLFLWVLVGWIGAKFASSVGGIATFLLGWMSRPRTPDSTFSLGLLVFSLIVGGAVGSLVIFLRFIIAIVMLVVTLIRVIIALISKKVVVVDEG